MGLDFTAINAIPFKEDKAGKGIGISAGADDTGSGSIYSLEKEKQEREQARCVYATYQQNIKRAGTLRRDIATGIKEGGNPLPILLKAIECISLMTGDTVLYSQCKEDIVSVYGWGLGDPTPLKEELEDAQKRLVLMTRAELDSQTPPDAQRRIQGAIKAHRGLIHSLEQRIEERA